MRSRSPKWLARNRSVRVVWAILCFAFLVAFLVALPRGAAAQSRGSVAGIVGQIEQREAGFGGGRSSSEEWRRMRMLNADRQKRMVSDANKLLKLAAQLNAQVSAAGQGDLSPAQLKEINEIEKLAHSVREKMSTSVRGTPISAGIFVQDIR